MARMRLSSAFTVQLAPSVSAQFPHPAGQGAGRRVPRPLPIERLRPLPPDNLYRYLSLVAFGKFLLKTLPESEPEPAAGSALLFVRLLTAIRHDQYELSAGM